MIKVFLIAAMLLASATYSLPAWAQSAELVAAVEQYEALNKQGKYAEAIPFAQTIIELAKKEYGEAHSNFALSLNNLASLYNDQGRYAEAEPLYKRSLAIGEKALGPEHPGVAISLGNLAILYNDQVR